MSSDQMRMWTFEATVSTMMFHQTGEVWVWASNEETARIKARKKVCDAHMLGGNCVNIGKLVDVE